MKQNKGAFTFVIDGNWWLSSRLLAFTDKLTFDDLNYNEHRKLLLESLTASLLSELKNLEGIIDSIIFVTDYKSWRKHIKYSMLIDDEPDFLYKANRVRDKDVNFENVFKAFYEWVEVLKVQYNTHTLKATGAEGDDYIMHLSNYLTSKGKNMVYLGTDVDISMCNRVNPETGAVSVFYRKKKSGRGETFKQENVLTTTYQVVNQLKINAGKAQTQFTEANIFSGNMSAAMVSSNNPSKKLLDFAEELDVFNMGYYILNKLVTGDKGDNVFGIMYKDKTPMKSFKYVKAKAPITRYDNTPYLVKHTPRIMQEMYALCEAVTQNNIDIKGYWKISDAKFDKALELMGLEQSQITSKMIYSDEFIKLLCEACYKAFFSNKANPDPKPTTKNLEWYHKRFIENRKFMLLTPKEIPNEVIESMNTNINESINAVQSELQSASKLPRSYDSFLAHLDIVDAHGVDVVKYLDGKPKTDIDNLIGQQSIDSPNAPNAPITPNAPQSSNINDLLNDL